MRKKIIRLRRRGSVRAVCFEVIVTFQDRRPNGSGLEKLGFINTLGKSQHYIAINCERMGF
jgi:ribosomal protein S16